MSNDKKAVGDNAYEDEAQMKPNQSHNQSQDFSFFADNEMREGNLSMVVGMNGNEFEDSMAFNGANASMAELDQEWKQNSSQQLNS